MPEGPWRGAWKDWWSIGSGWIVRALAIPAIGAWIGYFLVQRMLAHLQPWAAGLVGGAGAVTLWAGLTLIAALLKAPGRALREKADALAAANAKIRELEGRLTSKQEAAERQLEAIYEFTENGLAWKTIQGSTVTGSEIKSQGVTTVPETFSSFVTTVSVSGQGEELPQPLILRVRCSREPKQVFTTYYPDAADITRRPSYPPRASLVSIDGRTVYVEFREPQLRPPAALAVTVIGESETEIMVERVERRARRPYPPHATPP